VVLAESLVQLTVLGLCKSSEVVGLLSYLRLGGY
jgi:hypothetical protein